MNDFARLTPDERNARFEAGDGVSKARPRDPRPFVRSSFNAPPPPAGHPTLGVAANAHLYTDELRAPSLFVQRFELPNATKKKRKIFIQWSLRQGADGMEWIREGFPDDEQLPLYNLPEIKSSAPGTLVLVEGEKKVDAARVIFGHGAVVTTAAMGAISFLRTDATPLAEHPILIFPDNDPAGQGYVRTVTSTLHKLSCAIRVVDVAELVKIDGGLRGVSHDPVGWDCADAVLEWDNLDALRANVAKLTKPYQHGVCTDYTSVPEGPKAPEKIRSELRERIEALDAMDESRARAIVADAIKARVSGLAVDALCRLLANKLGVSLPTARKFWGEIEGEIKTKEAADENPKREALSREQRDAAASAEARKLQEERAEIRRRLEASCHELAHDPNLLTRLAKTARQAGVIGEDGSIRSAYIAASSRFNRRKAVCLLRRGAPAGGKNFVTDMVLRFIPEEDVVRVSSGSPLSLVYYGDGDEDALKHKIVYVAEAAILAERNGVESVLTIMLRLLISEGRIDHQVVVPRPNAPAATVRIRRNGPVVVLMTSARNNIEEELLTRLMTSDADESQEQTENVIEAALSNEDGQGDKQKLSTEIDKWVEYQRWIALDAPYEVTIPYRLAVLRALRTQRQAARGRGEKPKFKLRIRRDIQGFLTAISTSAILHKAQREQDESGRIIATLDDYRHAHEAFDPGLASLYKTTSPATTIAVVRAIEEMGATDIRPAKVTVTGLMEKLGISGRGTANDRLRDAEERGYIKLVEKQGGYGRTTPREYTIEKYAVEIEQETRSSFGPGVFPSREAVEAAQKNYSDEPQPPKYSGTDGTRRRGEPDYTDCTTVPEWVGPLKEKNSKGGAAPLSGSFTPNSSSDEWNGPGKTPKWFLEL